MLLALCKSTTKFIWYNVLHQNRNRLLDVIKCYVHTSGKNGGDQMAHVAKYTRGAINGLTNHWERKTENHSNKDIDNERTYLNYDLCEKEGDTLTRLQNRLDQVHCLNRKDVNVCADWVVTLPKSLSEKRADEQKRFFEETYAFLCERYGGEKNVLSANVHNDESTPHMHFAFLPVAWDAKKNRERVSAKIVVNRSDLRTFHDDLDAYLKQKIPHIYQEGILNDKTIGLETVEDIKRHSKQIQAIKNEQTEDLKVFKEPKIVLEKVKERAEFKKGNIFAKEDTVKVVQKDFDQLEIMALSGMKISNKLSKVEETAAKEKAELSRKVEKMEQELRFEQQKNVFLRSQNQLLQSKNEDLENNMHNHAETLVDDGFRQLRKEYIKLNNEKNDLKNENQELVQELEKEKKEYSLLDDMHEGVVGHYLDLQADRDEIAKDRDQWKQKFEALWDNTKHYLNKYLPNEMQTMVKSVKAWFKEDTGVDIEPEQKKNRQRQKDDGMSL